MDLSLQTVSSVDQAYVILGLPAGQDFACYSELFNHYWPLLHATKRAAVFADCDEQYLDGLQRMRLTTEAFVLICQYRHRTQRYGGAQYYHRLHIKQIELTAQARSDVKHARQRAHDKTLHLQLSQIDFNMQFAQMAGALQVEASMHEIDIRSYFSD